MISLFKEIPYYLILFKKYLGNKIYIAFILNIFASLAEGFGIALLIPFFETLDNNISPQELTGISLYIKNLFDFLNLPTNTFSFIIFIGLIFSIKGLLTFGSKASSAFLTGKLLEKLKIRLVSAFSKVTFLHYSKKDTGHFINISNEQTYFVLVSFNFFNQTIGMFINAFVYLIIILFISWQLCLSTIFLAIISFYAFSSVNKFSKKLSRKSVIEKSKLSNLLIQSLQSFKYLLATGQTNVLNKFIVNSIKNLTNLEIKKEVAYAFSISIREPLSVIGILIILFFQTIVFKQSLSSILVSLLLIYRSYTAIFYIQGYWQRVLSNIGSLELINNELNVLLNNKEISGTKAISSFQESIKFQNVSFSYSENLKTIKDISLVIPAKKTIAFVGESGSGKTTIVDLVSLILKPSNGEILIDNESSNNIDLYHWRKRIGYISQDNVMFNDTIANNICLWSGNLKDKSFLRKIERVAKDASIHDFIKSLPEGYFTSIGDRGVRLSGGQRQRIFIARELFRKPNLLILDEATSSLDSNVESNVQKSIDNLRGKITIIIIAHRLSTISNADKVLVFDKGRIIEEGTFSSLSKSNSSKFYQLLQKQINN